MGGGAGHFEIPAENEARARTFCSTVFGWKMNEMPGMDYAMVSTGDVGENGRPKTSGYIGGGIGKRGGHPKAPGVTIIVEELNATEKTLEKHGGKILQKKTPIGDGSMGYTGCFQDSEGNTIGIDPAGGMAPGSAPMP